jgi:hypothetical protein
MPIHGASARPRQATLPHDIAISQADPKLERTKPLVNTFA